MQGQFFGVGQGGQQFSIRFKISRAGCPRPDLTPPIVCTRELNVHRGFPRPSSDYFPLIIVTFYVMSNMFYSGDCFSAFICQAGLNCWLSKNDYMHAIKDSHLGVVYTMDHEVVPSPIKSVIGY
jgi:hypothetical protein